MVSKVDLWMTHESDSRVIHFETKYLFQNEMYQNEKFCKWCKGLRSVIVSIYRKQEKTKNEKSK
jgi:hypothetical protein